MKGRSPPATGRGKGGDRQRRTKPKSGIRGKGGKAAEEKGGAPPEEKAAKPPRGLSPQRRAAAARRFEFQHRRAAPVHQKIAPRESERRITNADEIERLKKRISRQYSNFQARSSLRGAAPRNTRLT